MSEALSLGPFIDLEDVWNFMRDEGIGTGHVGEMKKRALMLANMVGKIMLDNIPELIGDAELTAKFMSRIQDGKYVRASQVGSCGDGE